ncbi:hypothetical protein FNF27_06670 [Cafeteria roenbergensis]|uniref:Endonuclease/exonuclease/phosphatase domain-containing protein n=1 Tax=Cafeteria roenbergensis TaxID=33653 RepID=A0A5A8E040_CAFRO|nr:hypothetical protein FNF27_06670 [Cafeteria roenbergensis]
MAATTESAPAPGLLDGLPLLDSYSRNQLSGFKLRSRTPLSPSDQPTLRHIYLREAPGGTLPRSKDKAIARILELQVARLARASAGAEASDSDEPALGSDADEAHDSLDAEARAASRLLAAEAGAASGAGAATPPKTPPRTSSASPAPCSSPSALASPCDAAVATVLGANLKGLRTMARELKLKFLDTSRSAELREVVLLGKAGFVWDAVAKVSPGIRSPYVAFGDGVELGVLVKIGGPTPKHLLHAEIALMLADPGTSADGESGTRGRAKGAKNTATRIRDCIVRLLARLVARRDGKAPPGGTRDGSGTPAGGVRPRDAIVSPGSAAPTLRRQLSRGCLDRVPPAATAESPRAGKTVRVGSWNLRRFSCSSLSMRDMSDMVERLWRFDVVVLLEVFSGPHGSARDAVSQLCKQLDDRTGEAGAWGFILSPEAGAAPSEAGAAAATRSGAAGGERAAMIWRRSSAVCTSVEPGTEDEGGHCISFEESGAYQPAFKYFARPPMVASFRCGELDFVVVGYHAVWHQKSGWKLRGDAAREVEFKNLAVAVSSLRQQMGEVAAELEESDPEQAKCLKWAPILVCGDFNAELLNSSQHALFNPLIHVGGECLHSTGEPTVIATEEAKASAFDMVWMFPALATLEATHRMLEATQAEEEAEEEAGADREATAGESQAELDLDAALPEAPAGDADGDAVMVEVASYGIDDITGRIRGNLTNEGELPESGAPSFSVSPKPEALKAVGDAMALLGIPFASAVAQDPELQAKALVSFARSMVSKSLSDHCAVWVELLPTHMPVGTESQIAGRLDSAIERCTAAAGVATKVKPRLTKLPIAQVGARVSGGFDADDKERFVSGSMFA